MLNTATNGRIRLVHSLIGGMRNTQAAIARRAGDFFLIFSFFCAGNTRAHFPGPAQDLCAKHNIVPDIEVLPAEEINQMINLPTLQRGPA